MPLQLLLTLVLAFATSAATALSAWRSALNYGARLVIRAPPFAPRRFALAGQSGDDLASDISIGVGDVVQNLHGGKYQFSETQYLAGGSTTGRDFAESLYAGGGDDATIIEEEDGEMPRWALRLRDPASHASAAVLDKLIFDEKDKIHSISITNDERSWEKFYAFVLPAEARNFRVFPMSGTLAPRGGASNVCDETKPYSDGVIISVEWDSGAFEGGVDTNGHRECMLVVGTEAEVWRYHLHVA